MVTVSHPGVVSALVIPAAAGDGRMVVNSEVLDRTSFGQISSGSIKTIMSSLPLTWPHPQFQPSSAILGLLPQMKDDTFLVKCPTSLEKDIKQEDDFQKKMIEDAVTSLPNVFHEVFQMHNGQSFEIQNLQISLKEMQDKGKAEAEKNTVLAEELSAVKNKIYIAKEKYGKIEKTCKQHLANIKNLVRECANLQYQLEIKAVEHEAELRRLSRSREKIQSHKEKVKEFEESTSFVHEQIKSTESNLCDLKQQYDELNKNPNTTGILSGTALEKECVELKKQIAVSEEKLKLIYTEIETEKKLQAQIDQAIKVLHKRNAAQLTRMKRQLKDIDQINRQWLDQIKVLENQLAETKRNIAV